MSSVDQSQVNSSLAELLEDGLFVDGDWIESKDQDPNGDVRLVQLADVGDGVFRNRSSRFLTMEKAKELGCTFLEPGDVLVARMPEPLGRACIFPGLDQPAVTAVDVCIIRPNAMRARPEWLVKAINSPSFRSAMQEFIRGTTRQRISRRNLGGLPIRVPGVETQIAISQSVDRMQSKRANALEHLRSTKRVVERFRQSVLAAACSGRLTADWRRMNPADETAHTIVNAIADARRAKASRSPHATERQTESSKLPDGWAWTTIAGLVDVATGATPLRKRGDYYNGSVPWVTSGAVNAGTITAASEYVTELALTETNAKVFPAGTLLVAMYGEGQTRGRVAELGIDAATNQALAALLFDEHSQRLRPYLRLFLLENYERIRQLSFGGVQPNLSLGVIRDTPVPLPPEAEQHEIARRVEQLLVGADDVEGRVEMAAARLDRTSQAVLAKAFRGEIGTGARDACL